MANTVKHEEKLTAREKYRIEHINERGVEPTTEELLRIQRAFDAAVPELRAVFLKKTDG